MELSDKIVAVGKMQKFIDCHIEGEITLEDLSASCGYSKYYALRIFKELTGKTPFEVIRALRLTKAAALLRDSDCKVVDVALDNRYDSHDGFTKAFLRQFEITPQKYSKYTPAINYFIHYPIEAYYILKDGRESMPEEKVSRTVTVSVVERPARKLIFLRTSSSDYFAACEEVGCDWEGYYNSIPEKYDTAAGGRLPKSLVKPGTNGTAFFVEVPIDYDKPILEGYEIAEIPACTYLYFNGMPFDDQNDFCEAIGILNEAIGAYPFEKFGWKQSENAPYLGMGAEAQTGARAAVPVVKI
ncbi:hypothetical protein SDC9_139893 [bioreactor metagenome]|uniref:HTH araC/xylS-type domain-containing protein n=1 Tax=bioreactor metagenome TaxID=1076179 RepID=A0A645DTS4_9ZZZZ